MSKAKQQHLQQKGQTFQQVSTMQKEDVGDDEEAVGDGEAESNVVRVSDEVDMIDALTGTVLVIYTCPNAFFRENLFGRFEKKM